MVLLSPHPFCLAKQLAGILNQHQHMPSIAVHSHKQISFPDTTPSSPCEQQSFRSQGLPLVCPLDKTPSGFTKPTLFELTNSVLGWEPQGTPPTDPNKDMGRRSCLPVCLHPAMTSPRSPGGVSWGPLWKPHSEQQAPQRKDEAGCGGWG